MESEFLRWLRTRIPASATAPLGLSDDAAVVSVGGSKTVVTVDLLTEGVDFILQEVEPRRIGRKALAVNLSDIAAMGAKPVAAFAAVAIPRQENSNLARELAEGMIAIAAEYGVALAGGDTNSWDGPLVLSVTVLGELTGRGPLTRGGAMPGDQILVTGSLGGSILGKQFDFTPRIREALTLHEQYELHAGIDISDGLSRDLFHLCEESGCGAVLDLDSIPLAEAAHELTRLRADGVTPLEHALSDGEDFELILAVPTADARRILMENPLPIPVTRIGEFTAEPGLWQVDADGKRPLIPRGYEHRFEA